MEDIGVWEDAGKTLPGGGQRGVGRAGCLGVLLVALVFAYASYVLVPVYLAKLSFEDDLRRVASQAGAGSWRDEQILLRIQQAAAERRFEVTREDVEIRRVTSYGGIPELRIDVFFRREVAFPTFVHTFEFEIEVASFIGRF